MKSLFTLLFASLCIFGSAQELSNAVKPADLVKQKKNLQSSFDIVSPFSVAPALKSSTFDVGEDVTRYAILDLDMAKLSVAKNRAAETATLELPGVDGKKNLELELVKVDIFTSDFKLIQASSKSEIQVDLGVHYRGVVKGDDSSIVAISIFDNEVMGLISGKSGNLVLGKLEGNASGNEHILYDDQEILQKIPFECGTMDDGVVYKPNDLEYSPHKSPGDCIRWYIEVDNDIYNNKGGVAGATSYITGLLNEVSTLYSNESITTLVSEMVIWDVTSPYSSTSSSGMLSDFQAYLGTFNGDLAQLFSYQASGGIAAGFSGICNSNPDNSMCFSSINSTYAVVPTYSWSVMVATHEFGHLFGSRHTHACVWNGNGTAIDGCSGSTEGTCSLPGYPSNGGTIMSYCHLQSVGINFNEGFGPQPGNVIRNRVDNATCTSSCGPASCTDGIQNGDETGVDCGGSVCDPCPTCSDGIQNGDEEGVDCGGSNCAPCPCEGTDVTNNFPVSTLQHSGTGSSSTTLTYGAVNSDISFSITGLGAKLNGNPNSRYIDEVTVSYTDDLGSVITVGTYSGANTSSASIAIDDDVLSITVSLTDGYDGNASGTLSVNLGTVSSCQSGTCPDDDGDGVCNASDVCPGFDDNADADGDGIPDGCDSNNCTVSSDNFPVDPLDHSGTGSTSTTLSYAVSHQEVSFTITSLGAKTNGNPNNRYIDEVTVSYVDGNGSTVTHGTYSGTNGNSASVDLPGDVNSVTVSLTDGYDGNPPGTISVNLGNVSSCIPAAGLVAEPAREEQSGLRDWTIYPNPGSGIIYLNRTESNPSSESGQIQVLVYSINGTLVAQYKLSNSGRLELDLSFVPSGQYFIRLVEESAVSTHRWLKYE